MLTSRRTGILLPLLFVVTATVTVLTTPPLIIAYLPAQQTLRQHHSYSKATSIQLNERKRTSKSASGGFGNIMKDIIKTSDSFPYSGAVRPGKQSPQRIVSDESIMKPDYWQTGTPSKSKTKMLLPWMIEVKSSEEIQKMKNAGRLARHVLDMAGRSVKPGITTDEIDTLVYNEIIKVSTALAVCATFLLDTFYNEC
jgi:Xaa-Pro aminopeptidase